jgi:riboflavin synthase
MFTGIVTAVGRVRAAETMDGLMRLAVSSPYAAAEIAVGASICHAGVCLTVTAVQPDEEGSLHTADVAAESLAKTTLGGLRVGDRVNLERSLRMGDELGGHLVSGHVDGLGKVESVRPDGEGWRLRIRAPQSLSPLIASKGSIAVDGVSLTVNEVEGDVFGVLIIPHTWSATTLERLSPGAPVNLEADMFARYVQRILATRKS